MNKKNMLYMFKMAEKIYTHNVAIFSYTVSQFKKVDWFVFFDILYSYNSDAIEEKFIYDFIKKCLTSNKQRLFINRPNLIHDLLEDAFVFLNKEKQDIYNEWKTSKL